MLNLKRNSKGELVPAPGIRTRSSSVYDPWDSKPFNISRSKFSDFLTCPRCFYLDRVKGLASPGTPGWTLNETTDILLKKEFDECRDAQIAHRSFEKAGLKNIVPFAHSEMDNWRNSLHHGLKYEIPDTNITLSGGIDDIWQDIISEQLIVVDYKSQASSYPVNTEDYLNGTYHQGYKVQMDFYAFLLTKMGFDVAPIAYFYVCNADRLASGFGGKMTFEETLVPYHWDSSWIEPKIYEMLETLNSDTMPDSNVACENCAYSRERAIMEKGLG